MNPKKARELCEEYFRACDESGRYYTQAGLMVALGADKETWERWKSQRNMKGVINLAMARVQDDLEQRSDRMALSLIGKPPYDAAGGPGDEGTLRVVFGEDGSRDEYGG